MPAGYIAQKVNSGLYKNFTAYFNGIRLSNLTSEQIEVSTDEVTHEMQDTTTNYTFVFKDIPVSFPNGTKLFENLDSHYIELFKIVWQDFQEAMDEDFVKLSMNFEYDETVSHYCNGQGSNWGNLLFAGIDSELKYVFKDQDVEYNFGFNTEDIDNSHISALGKTFKITIGNESQTIIVRNSGDEETHDFEFNGEKITLTFNPQAYGGEEGRTVPRIYILGKAKAFAALGLVLRIELVA